MKYIISKLCIVGKNIMVLNPDNWDDYSYKTLFQATYIDEYGKRIEVGSIKIAKSGMDHGKIKDLLPKEFEFLPDDCFSLWQSAESYNNVKKIEDKYNLKIFESLNDIAYDLSLLKKYENQRIVTDSLFRFVSKHTCVNQFNRIAHGEALLTPYQFDYKVKQQDDFADDLILNFSVQPESLPPTNVHSIIGSNGTGKTTLIKNMIKSICSKENAEGEFIYLNDEDDELGYFESVMCISFSPFDNYSELEGLDGFKYIGVRKEYDSTGYKDGYGEINLLDDIENKFIESYKRCVANKTKHEDLVEMIKMLGTEGDILFYRYDFTKFINDEKELNHENVYKVKKVFRNLSAGHKEVLSIITRCIDQLAERTILFIDEPENHLHPPLLSSMIRGISKMLIKRNGVAIISTHSPIVLQEIPRSCVWYLNREGEYLFGRRLDIETFGTNIGVLTNEVFGYEVKRSGFNTLLQKVVNKCETYEEVLDEFNYQLGDEAKCMIRILLAQKRGAINEDIKDTFK